MAGSRVGERFGDYKLERYLGGGGFGEVYLGQHIYNRSFAAIKVLNARLTDPTDLKAFLDETRAMMRLRHPHIVRLLDFNVTNNVPFIVMDFASHGTLRVRHPKGQRVALPDVVSYVMAIAEALQHAHDNRIWHRDVKPENMLIGEQDNILLSDFGIAIVSGTTTPTPNNMPLVALGTPLYMAPEQIQGRARAASDQYALAICAYEWLTGRCPFNGTIKEIQDQHVSTPPASLCSQLPRLPVEVERVIFKALAKNYKDRYDSVQEFALALQQAGAPRPIIQPTAVPAPLLVPAPPPAQSSTQVQSTPPMLPPLPALPAIPRPPRHMLRVALPILLILFLSFGGILLYELKGSGKPTKPNIPILTTSQIDPLISPSITDDTGIGIKLMPVGTATLQIGIADSKSSVFTSNEYTDDNYRSNGEQCIDNTNTQQASQNVLTVIVVTTLSKLSDSVSLTIGNEELQGVCLWQQHNLTSYPLHVLIANIGTKDTKVLGQTVPEVTRQIALFAKHNKNFLGVVGFSFSQSVSDAMDALNKADIPVVSGAASSTKFADHNWSYFHRIVPNDDTEGLDAAAYARNVLQTKQAFVFSDSGNDYSGSLGDRFSNAFGSANVTPETYSVKNDEVQAFDPSQIKKLSDYFRQSPIPIPPTVVFCACYASDFSKLRQQLPTNMAKNVFFMGGEALYELGAYTNNYANIYFTAFSFPDTIYKLCVAGTQCQAEQLQFYANYCQLFDPQDYQPTLANATKLCNGYDTKGRPGPHAIQSYDAIYALLQAYTQAKEKSPTFSRAALQQAFNNVSFEGMSGHIDFKNASPPSDPNNKAVLVLCVDGNHQTHMLNVYGQFLDNTQGASSDSQGVQYDPYTICQ